MDFSTAINIPSDFLDHLPPTYKTVLLSMIESYKKEADLFEKFKILENFGTKFLLLPQHAQIHYQLEHRFRNVLNSPNHESNKKILGFHSKTYDMNDERLFLNRKYLNILFKFNGKDWHNILFQPEKLLTIPHFNSIYITKMYLEANCVKPFPNATLKQYEKTEFLYKQFMRDDLSHDEWVLYLNEIENDEVIIGLFEHRLGWKKGCINKELWKMYFDFLKDKDQIAYLDLFQRYTRFFIEDKEKVEEYRNEIERISKMLLPVSEYWIDTILYEFDFGTKEAALNAMKRVLAFLGKNVEISDDLPPLEYFNIIKKADPPSISEKNDAEFYPAPKKLPISCYYPRNEFEGLKKTQNFSIPRTFIFYVTQNIKIKHQILFKLFNSCKYFFAIQPTPICYRLVLGWKESSKYIDQSLFLNDKDLDFPALDNLYITSTLDILTNQPKTFSNNVRRLYRCEAKYGDIDNQIITSDELKYIYYGLHPIGHMFPGRTKIIHNGKEVPQMNFDIWNINFPKNNIQH